MTIFWPARTPRAMPGLAAFRADTLTPYLRARTVVVSPGRTVCVRLVAVRVSRAAGRDSCRVAAGRAARSELEERDAAVEGRGAARF